MQLNRTISISIKTCNFVNLTSLKCRIFTVGLKKIYMRKYRVLILGSGGREHTLAWKISQSPVLDKLYIAPGNGGSYALAENIILNPLDFESVSFTIIKYNIDILVVGPEEPLVKGIVDYLRIKPSHQNLIIVGPDSSGAMLEGSKAWSKEFMLKYNIPTAKYKNFNKNNKTDAFKFLNELNPPYVIKASGLAAGKGVIITESREDAEKTINEMLEGSLGDAGKEIVIEEFLDGIEVSVFVLTNGENYALLPEAKDYKRIGDNNTGPNTGGMGAVSPVPFADEIFMDKVRSRIIEPTLSGLRNKNIVYQGFIFFGLINVKNEPYVIEYNVRMGDPETQAVLPRLKNDLLELFVSMQNKNLDSVKIEISSEIALTVVMASGGYPTDYTKGYEIDLPETEKDILIFHAGTTVKNNKLITSGGRVLALTSLANSIGEARGKAYNYIEKINFNNRYFRKDIGKDLI